MKTNNNLTIKEQLRLLNIMMKYLLDHDSDGDGIIYIVVSLEENIDVIKELIPARYESYIREFADDSGGIDITNMVWCELDWDKKDIWVSFKKGKFFIAHFWTYIAHQVRVIKKNIKYKVHRLKCRYKNYMYVMKRKREEKQSLRWFINRSR